MTPSEHKPASLFNVPSPNVSEELAPPKPLIFKQVALQSASAPKEDEPEEAPLLVGFAPPLLEIILVLGILTSLAVAAFIVYPKVQQTRALTMFAQHVQQWQTAPTPTDDDFIFRTLSSESGVVNEIQVISKPSTNKDYVIKAVFARVGGLPASDLSQEQVLEEFKKIGVVPNDPCIESARMEENSVSWVYKDKCSTVPQYLARARSNGSLTNP